MTKRSTQRPLVWGALLASSLGLTGAALHAQATGRPSLAAFPDAQAALTAVSVDDLSALNSMLTTLERGDPTFYFATASLRANPAARVTLIRTLGPMLPGIVEGEPFVSMYGGVRAQAARARIGAAPVSPAVARADVISEAQMRLRGLEERLAAPGLSRRDRSSLESEIETTRGTVTRLERESQDPSVRTSEQASFGAATTAYDAQRQAVLTELEATLPTEARVLVRRRLEEFVAGCRDVNFRAPTTVTGGVTRFTNAADEARPKIWKLCFRAGQGTVTEARRVATSWLARLSDGSAAASGSAHPRRRRHR